MTRRMASCTRRPRCFSNWSPTLRNPTRDNELAAPGLLVARGEGALAQEIEFILVQAALEP
jgi:hypothetical protein